MGAKDALPWVETNNIMIRHEFPEWQVIRAQIWAAKHRRCPKCGSLPFTACRNLNNVHRTTKFPHVERIDYVKLKNALHDRGYK